MNVPFKLILNLNIRGLNNLCRQEFSFYIYFCHLVDGIAVYRYACPELARCLACTVICDEDGVAGSRGNSLMWVSAAGA